MSNNTNVNNAAAEFDFFGALGHSFNQVGHVLNGGAARDAEEATKKAAERKHEVKFEVERRAIIGGGLYVEQTQVKVQPAKTVDGLGNEFAPVVDCERLLWSLERFAKNVDKLTISERIREEARLMQVYAEFTKNLGSRVATQLDKDILDAYKAFSVASAKPVNTRVAIVF